MAQTDSVKVGFLFDSTVTLDASVVGQFIVDAEQIVAQYDLSITGTTSTTSAGKLVDYNARFLNRVLAGARVKNISKRPNTFTTVSSLPTQDDELALAADIFASSGDYWVQDLINIELAERYKTGSLLVERGLVNSMAVKGYMKAQLGPMEKVVGANAVVGGTSTPVTDNILELRFLQIVGAQTAGVGA